MKAEPAKAVRAVPTRLILLVALLGAAGIAAAGLLPGGRLFKSTTAPLPPIPPAEESKPEMADGIPVPALPSATAPKRAGTEESPAEPAAPAPPAAPEPPSPARPAGGSYERGLAAYRKGDIDGAAAIWKSHLKESGAAYTISVVAACQPGTVQAAFDRFGPDRGLFVLPLRLSDKNCYRVVLGSFPDVGAARSALGALPPHLKRDLEVREVQSL